MTNNNDTDITDITAVTASMMKSYQDRRLAAIEEMKNTPIVMVPPSGRKYFKRNRRTSVPHRAIR